MLTTLRKTIQPVTALVVLALLVSASAPCSAAVEWEFLKSLDTDSRPIDVAVSADGKVVFVLTENGTIFIFGADGTPVDRVAVGPQAERIAVDPEGERIYVTNRQAKRVDVVQVDTLREINLSGAPFKGREKAPVVLAVFSDFQCIYCAGLAPVLEQVLQTFPDKVKIVFKHYPLSSHKLAVKAALTAQAAHLQGKFWGLHDEFFKYNDQLTDEKIQEAVRSQGINAEQLERDLRNPRVTAHVQDDINEAVRIGVRGVPTVFINGKRLRDRSYDFMAAAVEKELKKYSSTK